MLKKIPLIGLRACVAAALAVTAAAQAGFDDPFDTSWPTMSSTARIGAADITGSGFMDAVVLPDFGSTPVLLHSVNLAKVSVDFPNIVNDMAVFNTLDFDGAVPVLTVNATGLRVMEWNDTTLAMDVSLWLPQYAGALEVAVIDFASTSSAYVAVLHANRRSVSWLEFDSEDGTYLGEIGTMNLVRQVEAFALLDIDADGFPEFAAEHSDRLEIYDMAARSLTGVMGTPVGGLLTRLETDNFALESVAWVTDNGSEHEIQVVGSNGVSSSAVVSPWTIDAFDVADYDQDGDADLACLSPSPSELIVLNGTAGPGARPVFSSLNVLVVDNYAAGLPDNFDTSSALVHFGELEQDGYFAGNQEPEPDILVNGSLYRGTLVGADQFVTSIQRVRYSFSYGISGDLMVLATLALTPPAIIPDDAHFQIAGYFRPEFPTPNPLDESAPILGSPLAGSLSPPDTEIPPPWYQDESAEVTVSLNVSPPGGMAVDAHYLAAYMVVETPERRALAPRYFAFTTDVTVWGDFIGAYPDPPDPPQLSTDPSKGGAYPLHGYEFGPFNGPLVIP